MTPQPITPAAVWQALTPRPPQSHKGTFGRVLIAKRFPLPDGRKA